MKNQLHHQLIPSACKREKTLNEEASLKVDSKGNLYTGEVGDGQRLQKFILKGNKALPTLSGN